MLSKSEWGDFCKDIYVIGEIAARIYMLFFILIRLGRLLQGYICYFNQIGEIAARIYMLF
jgi:hypothetical protein